MTDPQFDVIVVGAGPAGSLASIELARRGASVLLVDRSLFPRPKVCGCCLNPRALETLREAGRGGLTARLGAVPLTSLTLGSGGRQATIERPLGVAISRDALDQALAQAALDQGATFLSGTSATLLPLASPDFRSVRLKRGAETSTVEGRFVVSATGLSDSLREEDAFPTPAPSGSKIGAGVIAPKIPDGFTSGRVYMACGPEGYVGLVALEDGRLDLAAALRPGSVRDAGGIGPLALRILKKTCFPEVPGVERLPWKGTPGLSRNAPALAGSRVLRVGDAAGYVEPFTGEGMAWALAGGLRLAAILTDHPGSDALAVERAWRVAYRREVTRTQWVCRGARLALRTPWLTRALVRLLNVSPGLADPLIRSIHRTRSSPTLSGP